MYDSTSYRSHNDEDNDDDDDTERESSSLLRRSVRDNRASNAATTNNNNENGNRGKRNGMVCDRMLLFLCIAALVGVSLYYQSELQGMNEHLAAEHITVANLQETVNQHGLIMQRFNSSVTNSDVLDRLKMLETNLHDTSKEMHSALDQMQKDIASQLDQTIQELSTTVDEAEEEIQNQVDKVKKDVEQYVRTTQDQFSMENNFMVYQLAGTFTVLSCLISMWHMTAHLRKLHEPTIQRKILAILWMSPIYAITSWFSLVFHQAEGYLAIIKDGYEAYIIYQFLSFCIAVMGKGDRQAVVELLAHRADHLTPPFRLFVCFELVGCCKPEPYENSKALADAILLQCQQFAMQFVFFRPLTTTAMVLLQKFHYYGAGSGPADYRAPQFYICLIQNISIFTAFTGLLKFYHAVDQDLAWCRPFAKFLCIKGVVFMTFWQGLAISVLAQTTIDVSDAEEWAKSTQNFLICLEMLLFSIAHFYCFPTEEWEVGYRAKLEQQGRGKFGDSMALGDFVQDLRLILRPKSHKKKHPKEPAIKEEDEDLLGKDDESTSDDDTTRTDDYLTGDSSSVILHNSSRVVARALMESSEDDASVAKAKQRLLHSGVLGEDIFRASTESTVSALTGNIDDSERDIQVVKDSLACSNSPGENAGNSSSVNAQNSGLGGGSSSSTDGYQDDDPEDASESTCLLGAGGTLTDGANSSTEDHGTTFTEILRPSIFTTVASVAEIDRRRWAAEEARTKRQLRNNKTK